jgi:hypothetical protein
MIVKSPITAIAVPKLLKNAHILYAQSIIILKKQNKINLVIFTTLYGKMKHQLNRFRRCHGKNLNGAK